MLGLIIETISVQAQRFAGGLCSHISKQSVLEGGKVVRLCTSHLHNQEIFLVFISVGD
jgi:hypothetical protein